MAMIDNPKQVAGLLAKLESALPLPAIVTPRLAATLSENSPSAAIPKQGLVTWVSNAGEEGGIMCKLSFAHDADDANVVVTSITHLAFDPRQPLAREIAAYQKHRVKKLRRQNGQGNAFR